VENDGPENTASPLAAFITAAMAAGWSVENRKSSNPILGPEVTRRYPRLVPSHFEFLKSIAVCVNAKKTSWFLCESDYRSTNDTTPEPWRWNEYELMSLDAAAGDADWQEKIRRFWDTHLPIFISVEAGDYDYVALDVSKEGFGQVVHGVSPEFEEVSPLAATFNDFLTEFARSLRGEPPSDELSPLKLFI